MSGLLAGSDPGLWSSGSLGLSCIEYISCASAGPGVYLVDPDGDDPANAFLAQCAADGTMTPL